MSFRKKWLTDLQLSASVAGPSCSLHWGSSSLHQLLYWQGYLHNMRKYIVQIGALGRGGSWHIMEKKRVYFSILPPLNIGTENTSWFPSSHLRIPGSAASPCFIHRLSNLIILGLNFPCVYDSAIRSILTDHTRLQMFLLMWHIK